MRAEIRQPRDRLASASNSRTRTLFLSSYINGMPWYDAVTVYLCVERTH